MTTTTPAEVFAGEQKARGERGRFVPEGLNHAGGNRKHRGVSHAAPSPFQACPLKSAFLKKRSAYARKPSCSMGCRTRSPPTQSPAGRDRLAHERVAAISGSKASAIGTKQALRLFTTIIEWKDADVDD